MRRLGEVSLFVLGCILAWSFCFFVQVPRPDAGRGGEDLEATEGARAEAWWYQRRVSENGKIPFGALERALAQRQELAASQPSGTTRRGSSTNAGAPPAPDPLVLAFESLGPTNVGGRIRDLYIKPRPGDDGGGGGGGGGGGRASTDETMWAVSPGGGIWKTTNSGANWTLCAGLPNLNFSCIAGHFNQTTGELRLYAGTGEGYLGILDGVRNTAAARGGGVWYSDDEGATWLKIGATDNANFAYSYSILANPANRNELLASTESGVWKVPVGPSGPLVKPAKKVLAERLSRMLLDPAMPGHILAGTARSTTRRAKVFHGFGFGDQWIGINAFLPGSASGRAELAVCQTHPNVVYACVDTLVGNNKGSLWKSEDGGNTFIEVAHPGGDWLSQGSYANAIWVNPVEPTMVIVGGMDLYRSVDSGSSWSQISDWSVYQTTLIQQGIKRSVHADHHVIVSDPQFGAANESRVWFGCDGGVFECADPGTVTIQNGWTPRNDDIGCTQFYYASTELDREGVVGGLQDNGTIRLAKDGAPGEWMTIYGGDGGAGYEAPTPAGTHYTSYVEGQAYRLAPGQPAADLTEKIRRFATFPFIPKIVYDPARPDEYYIGAKKILYRLDPGVAPVGNTERAVYKNPIDPDANGAVTEFARDPNDPDRAWVGQEGYGPLCTTTFTDGDTTDWDWKAVAGMPIARTLADIEVVDHNRVYASFMGYEYGNLWRTTDGGAHWENLHQKTKGALPQAPISAIKVVRSNVTATGLQDVLVAGTDVGVFISNDNGVTWSPTEGDLGPVVVEDLFFESQGGKKFLHVATHGRGIWRSLLPIDADVQLASRADHLSGTLPIETGGDNVFTSYDGQFSFMYSWLNFQFGIFQTGHTTTVPYGATFSGMPSSDGLTGYRADNPDGPHSIEFYQWLLNTNSEHYFGHFDMPFGATYFSRDGGNYTDGPFWEPRRTRLYGSMIVYDPLKVASFGYIDLASNPITFVPINALELDSEYAYIVNASPNGRYLAIHLEVGSMVSAQRHKLEVLDVDTGDVRVVQDDSGDYSWVRGSGFLTDDGRLLYCDLEGLTMHIKLDNLSLFDFPFAYPVTTPTTWPVGMSADGRRIVVYQGLSNPEGTSVTYMDLDPLTGKTTKLLTTRQAFGFGGYYWSRLAPDGRHLVVPSIDPLTRYVKVSHPAGLWQNSYLVTLPPVVGPRSP